MTARVEAEGRSIEEVIADLFKATLARALEGDVRAAKLLIERLCGKDPTKLDIKQEVARPMSDVERAARLQAILASAERRRKAEEEFLREALDGLPTGVGG